MQLIKRTAKIELEFVIELGRSALLTISTVVERRYEPLKQFHVDSGGDNSD